ncbi:MAG: hypothetical protein KDA93_23555 [Planctomycetaceae bacterium]|nr:hypothetical protein [Planctomycetaceae bacterium]
MLVYAGCVTPPLCMDAFLTISQAAKRSGKSTSTIRRFVHSILDEKSHSDREHIQPTDEEIQRFEADGVQYAYKLSEELLLRAFPEQETEPEETTAEKSDVSALVDLLKDSNQLLKSELDEKNRQIANFQERQRETNILLKDFQQRLAIAGPKAESEEGTVTVEPQQQQAIRGTEKPEKKSSSNRFFKRLFNS